MMCWIIITSKIIVSVIVTLVMTAQTMSFHYELARKGFSTEKAQHLVTLQNNICCFIGMTFTLSLNFLQLSIIIFSFLNPR